MRISIVAGKFDILHSGHIDSIIKASRYGDYLIIITHKDEIVAKTSGKGICFNPLNYRCMLLRGLLLDRRISGEVVIGIDENGTVCKTLEMIRSKYPKEQITYCKGGDRTIINMDSNEVAICERLGIKIQYGIGDLLNSSTSIYKRIS